MACMQDIGSGTESVAAPAGARVAVGRSGRGYAMVPMPASAPVEGEDMVYALSSGVAWGWVGSARDLIDSPESRARFRTLSAAGATLYRLGRVADALERMTIAWDLESTDPSRRAA